MTLDRSKIDQEVDKKLKDYQNIALEIHKTPEVSNYEFFASKTLSERLAEEGFTVKLDVAGHRTGFDARYKSNNPRPVVVFYAEYDALPGIGHACGHNLFGTTSSLAAVALKTVIDEVGGEIRVYGTPGEEGGENGSAKGSFVREGFFKDVDIALGVHPGHGHGRRPDKYKSAYCAAKAGQISFISVVAMENAQNGITANSILPGPTNTELIQNRLSDLAKQDGTSEQEALETHILGAQWMKELIEPSEIADLAVFLASDGPAKITGEDIAVDGGE